MSGPCGAEVRVCVRVAGSSVRTMGFRMRKSFTVMPGVRMTFSPHGVSTSFGVTGARVTYSSRGRVTRTLGVPGTGMSYVTTHSTHRAPAGVAPHHVVPAPVAAASGPAASAHPGVFAPAWQKALFKALPQATYDSLHEVAVEHPEAAHVCMLLSAFLVSGPDALAKARPLLENLMTSGWDPDADEFVQKYLAAETRTVQLAPGLAATLHLCRPLIELALAEVRKAEGDLEGAISLVESMEPTTASAICLADLYTAAQRWQDVVDLTNGDETADDFSVYLLAQRGVAFRELGYHDAARESFRAALARRSAPPVLRHHALIERALTDEAEHKWSMARRDLEHVLAEDPDYPGLKDLLDELPATGSSATTASA